MRSAANRSARAQRRASPASGELALIRAIQSRAAQQGFKRGDEVRLGIGDDCAILRPRRGEEIVVTTDFSLEGRHFRRAWHSPASIGHRTLARGLSDLAAMGTRPVAAFLSLALPKSVASNAKWMQGFLDGFFHLAEEHRVPIAGGDTSEAPDDSILADVVLLGAVSAGRALRRDGAQPGDRLFVTGTLGGAAAQLEELQRANPRSPAQRLRGPLEAQPHFFPQPRLAAGRALMRGGATTVALDLSDGLSTDLAHLCTASALCAEVYADWLPLSPLLSTWERPDALRAALHGGEDYELLFTVRPDAQIRANLGGVRLTEIGKVVERRKGRPQMVIVDAAGRRSALRPGGWEHLR